MTAWHLCPARTCGHAAVAHDGDGIDEDLVCAWQGCDCRSTLDEHGRVAPGPRTTPAGPTGT